MTLNKCLIAQGTVNSYLFHPDHTFGITILLLIFFFIFPEITSICPKQIFCCCHQQGHRIRGQTLLFLLRMVEDSASGITYWLRLKWFFKMSCFKPSISFYYRITVLFHGFQDSPSLYSYFHHEQNVRLYVKISYILLKWGKVKWQPPFLVIFYFACFMFLLKLAQFHSCLKSISSMSCHWKHQIPLLPISTHFYHIFVNCGNCLAAQ